MTHFSEAVIAVVGVAKNCGKTTTLNYLVESARQAGLVVGLCSVGIDGESKDVLLETPKPPIRVHPGQLVATTRQMLHASSADVEFLEMLGFTTPLGEAVIARVASDGEVVLGGLRHRADVVAAVAAMRQAGADQVWIDGAYGRVVAAQPGLSDGVVVATGAVVDSRPAVIVEKTAALVERLTLPAVDEAWQRRLIEAAIAQERVLLGGPTLEPIALPERSALLGLSRGRDAWSADVTAVAVPGLVSDRVAHELLRHRTEGVLLVPDGTCLHLDPRVDKRLRAGWELRALRTCRLLAISYNPTSLQGHTLPAELLERELRARFPNTSVFNPLVGIH